jgi:hypothetical protein
LATGATAGAGSIGTSGALGASAWRWIAWGVVGFLLISPAFYRLPYERDYDILWEAGYRLSFGQAPYRDFGMPIGPVGPWLVGGWMDLFGRTFSGLKYLDLLLDVVGAVSVWTLLRAVRFSEIARFAALALFVLVFTTKNSFPFYNTMVVDLALAGFALLASGVLDERPARRRWLIIGLGGAVAALAVFVKQDTAAVAVVVEGLWLAWRCRTHGRSGLLDLAWWAAGGVAATVVILAPVWGPDFLYWFDYGQPPHASRVAELKNMVGDPISRLKIGVLILAVLALIGLGRRTQDQTGGLFAARLAVISGPILMALLAGAISGRGQQVSQYGVAFAAAPLAELLLVLGGGPIAALGLVAGLLLMTPLIPQPLLLFEGLLHHQKTTPDGRRMSLASAAGLSAFGDVYLTDEAIGGLKTFVAIAPKHPCWVLDLSEFEPVEAQAGVEPCRGYPLWVDQGVTLLPRGEQKIVSAVRGRQFGLIMLEVDAGIVGPAILKAVQETYRPTQCFRGDIAERQTCLFVPK